MGGAESTGRRRSRGARGAAELPEPPQGRGLPRRGAGRGVCAGVVGGSLVARDLLLDARCTGGEGRARVALVPIPLVFWVIGLLDGFLMAPVSRLRGKKRSSV